MRSPFRAKIPAYRLLEKVFQADPIFAKKLVLTDF